MKRLIYAGIIALGISIFLTGTCLAGDMNADEARVYSAASGTFAYNGTSYKATSSYLAQLNTYLCKDDINLTASQADASIRTMNRTSNIKKAIASGYLYMVTDSKRDTEVDTENGKTSTEGGESSSTESNKEGSNNTETTTTEKSTEQEKSDGKTNSDQNKQDNTTDKDGKTDTGKNADSNANTKNGNSKTDSSGLLNETTEQTVASSDNNITVFDSAAEAEEAYFSSKENQQERESILNTRPEKEKAKTGTITYDEESNEIVFVGNQNQTIVISSLFNQINDTNARNLFAFVEVILLIITMISGYILWKFHCYSFQISSHKNHYDNYRMRRKLRKILGGTIVIVMAVNVLVVLAGAGIRIGLFQNARVTDTLSASGYYHESYNDLLGEVHTKMIDAGCPENACDDVITYDNYMFATRNHVQMALVGKEASAEYLDISSEVAYALEGVTYLTDDSRQEIGEDVLKLYQQYVDNIIGGSMYGMKNSFYNVFDINIILAGVNIVLSAFSLLFMDHYKHRGMKKIAATTGFDSIMLLVISIVVAIGKPYSNLYIEPDYLYLFVVYYIRYMTKVLICFAIGGGFVAALIQLVGKEMKKRLQTS